MAHYRPLAKFLIGSGARISEALAIRFGHLDLDQGVVRIYGQRGRDGDDAQPKGKRFRSVRIGPGLIETLTQLRDARAGGPDNWIHLHNAAERLEIVPMTPRMLNGLRFEAVTALALVTGRRWNEVRAGRAGLRGGEGCGCRRAEH